MELDLIRLRKPSDHQARINESGGATSKEKDLEGVPASEDLDLCGALGERAGRDGRWPCHHAGVKGSSRSLCSVLQPQFMAHQGQPNKSGFPK